MATCPFVLKLLVCFMFADAVERLIELLLFFRQDTNELAPSPYYPNVAATLLWVLVHVLLGVLLLLRTWWGRIWTQGIFVIHILFLAHNLAVRHPEVWLYLEPPTRFRLLATLTLDMAIVAYLFSPTAKRYLHK